MITLDMMTPTYKMEYEFGWITKDDLASYVEQGLMTKAGYKEILGVDYDTQSEAVSQPQA
jgi:hypothetical protein